MDVEILGPMQVRDGAGREVRLPGGRERALFALLLISRGEVVSVDRIVDALWGERPPESAAKAVQGYVSHLRRALEAGPGRGAGGAVVTRAPGYLLRADAVALDAERFERLAAEGRRALEDGSAAEAAGLVEEALALWRGPALAEFAFDDFAQEEVRRLEELRLAATEDRIEALLRLGRHGELAGELEALVAAHPLRERMRGQAMLALYRSGRQAGALALYRDCRRLLSDELGLEPGPELQRLERAILAHDPALEAPAAALPPVAAPAAGPPALPAAAPSRRRRLIAVAAVAAAAVAAALIAMVLAGGGGPGAVEVAVPSVVAVDPATNRLVASVAVGSRPVSVVAGEGAVWVGDARDGTVTRIDPAGRRVVTTIGIGAPAIDLAAGEGAVWVATGGFGEIVQIDPRLDAAVDRIALAGPGDPVVPPASAVGVGGGLVWAGAYDGLVRIDPGSARITGRVDLGRAPAIQIAARGGALWATTIRRRAKRVETSSAQVTAEFYAGVFVLPVALDASAAWVAAGDDGLLWKLDPVTGAPLLTVRAGRGANAIALGAGAVWVTSWPDEALVRVDQRTGAVLETIPVGGPPQDVAVGGGLVWVAVGPGQPLSG